MDDNPEAPQLRPGDRIAWDWVSSTYEDFEVEHFDGVDVWYIYPGYEGEGNENRISLSILLQANLRITRVNRD